MMKRIILGIVVCTVAFSLSAQAKTVNGKIKANKGVMWSFTTSDSNQYEVILMWQKKSSDIDIMFWIDDGGEVLPVGIGFSSTESLERVTLGMFASYETVYVLMLNTGAATNYWLNYQVTQSDGLKKEPLMQYHGEFAEVATQSTKEALLMEKASQLMDRLRSTKH